MVASFSDVTICNMALSHLGADDRIQSLTEASAVGRQMKLWYTPCRLEALQTYDWGFARRRRALASHSEAPPDEWAYRYQYPADCVEFRRIWNPLGRNVPPVPFTQETAETDGTRSILTDLDEAIGVWTMDVVDTSMFSVAFATSLSHLIAARSAIAITKKQSLMERQYGLFQSLSRKAVAQDANANALAPPRNAVWIDSRQ